MICALITAAGFVAGAVIGRASTGNVTRGILKTAIKGSLAAGKAIQTVASEAREGLSDLAAEAKADLTKAEHAVEHAVEHAAQKVEHAAHAAAHPAEHAVAHAGKHHA